MSITNYPKVLKYAVGDRPYRISKGLLPMEFETYSNNGANSGFCQRVKVVGWKTKVSNPSGDGNTAVQENYYIVKDILTYVTGATPDDAVEIYSIQEYTISETNLFSSKNHLLSSVKGKYLNSVPAGQTENAYLFFSSLGEYSSNLMNNGDWIDWAGMNFKNCKFVFDTYEVAINYHWQGTAGTIAYVAGEEGGSNTLILDNCNFTGATMPADLNTRAKMRTNCWSYDETTTIWTDGTPLARS